MSAVKETVAAKVSQTAELIRAVQEADVNGVIAVLKVDPSLAIQSIGSGYTPLHYAVFGILKGVLDSPKQATTTFSPTTSSVGTLLRISVILIRHGAKLAAKNQDQKSSEDFLMTLLGVSFNNAGFFPSITLDFFRALGITTGADLKKLLSLEEEFYNGIQSIKAINQQLSSGSWIEPALSQVKYEQSVIIQFIDVYQAQIAMPRTINDLTAAIAEVMQIPARVKAYLRENKGVQSLRDSYKESITRLLESELVLTIKNIEERNATIIELLKQTTLPPKIRQQLLQYHYTIIAFIKRCPTATSHQTIPEVRDLVEQMKNFLETSGKYLTAIVVPPQVIPAAPMTPDKTVLLSTTAIPPAQRQFPVQMRTGFISRAEAEAEAADLKAFGVFLDLVKAGDEVAVQEQLVRHPNFATKVLQRSDGSQTNAIIVAAASMENGITAPLLHISIFLIRRGASLMEEKSGVCALEFINLAVANLPIDQKKGILAFFKAEVTLYALIKNYQDQNKELVIDKLLGENIGEEHKKWLAQFKEEIGQLITSYYSKIQTLSQSQRAIALLNELAERLELINQEQTKILTSGIARLCAHPIPIIMAPSATPPAATDTKAAKKPSI